MTSKKTGTACRPSIEGHLLIARFDHWVKNVFVVPGIIVAISMQPDHPGLGSILYQTILGLISAGLIASSNYVINEILDAPYDLKHPIKRNPPVPSGRVSIPLGYLQWLVLMVAGGTMDGAIVVVFPAPPAVFGVFLAICLAYLAYAAIKLVVSLWTGA